MGCFDSVLVPCPRCGRKNEFQSKSGRCCLDVYELADAPSDVLKDVNRHAPCECECGCLYKVDEVTHTPIEVGAGEKNEKKTQEYRNLAAVILEDLALRIRKGEVTKVQFSWDGGSELELTTHGDKDPPPPTKS